MDAAGNGRDPRLSRAENLFKSGLWTEALDDFRRVSETRAGNDEKVLASMRQGINLSNLRAYVLTIQFATSSACFLELGDFSSAIHFAKQGIKHNPGYTKVMESSPNHYSFCKIGILSISQSLRCLWKHSGCH